jgi:hypothetical protein
MAGAAGLEPATCGFGDGMACSYRIDPTLEIGVDDFSVKGFVQAKRPI